MMKRGRLLLTSLFLNNAAYEGQRSGIVSMFNEITIT